MPDTDVKIIEKWDKILASSITLNIASPLIVTVGETSKKLTVTINPSTVYPLPSVTYSSNNPCVAIDSNGYMTFKSAGTATITATVNDGSGTKTNLVVNVKQTYTCKIINTSTMDGTRSYEPGTEISVDAGAFTNKKFKQWNTSGVDLGSTNKKKSVNFTMPNNSVELNALWYLVPKITCSATMIDSYTARISVNFSNSFSKPNSNKQITLMIDGQGNNVTTDSNGNAFYNISGINGGNHLLRAIFDGDEEFCYVDTEWIEITL